MPRIAPFALFIAFIAAQSLFSDLLDEPAHRWLTVIRGLAAAAVLAYFWRSYTELHRYRFSPSPLGEGRGEGGDTVSLPDHLGEGRGEGLNWILAILVGLGVFAAWITFDTGWAVFDSAGKGFVPLRDGQVDWVLVALRMFALVAVVPVMEELFWRSFLMRWIDQRDFLSADPRRASFTAFALSCGLFSLEHSLWFAGLVAGAAYGWLYIRSGNLWIPITAHAITNGTLGLWILATGNWRLW